ncbi:MAG: GTP 3',8-cyclase MoaA [Clostridium sp.]
MNDIQGRKIDYLRISLTDKCNLNCKYCMPKGICNEKVTMKLGLEEINEIIKAFADLGINKIRFTGGEPLIVEGIEDIIKNTSEIKGIKDISITTNGINLAERIEALKKSGLTRVNVSMDTLQEEKYEQITGKASFSKVRAGIIKAMDLGVTPVKLNVVMMKEINMSEMSDFINLTRNYEVDVRFIELMPIGAGIKLFKDNFISASDVIKEHPELISLEHQKASTAELFKVKDGKGRIGFITPLSCKFCNECNRVRLTSEGKIKPCLHSEEEYDILKHVRQAIKAKGKEEYFNYYETLKLEIEKIIYNKPAEHTLVKDGRSKSHRAMFQIGG